MSEIEEFSVCPFCGSSDVSNELIDDTAICYTCNAFGPNKSGYKWNDRHVREVKARNLGSALPNTIPLILCESCKQINYAKADGTVWDYCPSCGGKVVSNG